MTRARPCASAGFSSARGPTACDHLKGDDVLKHLIHSVRHEIREIDSISRFGGEEFVIIMADTDITGAKECALRILNALRGLKYPGFPESFALTVSMGLTAYRPGESIDELLDRADQAMYKAKTMGRDRVIMDFIV